MIPSLAICQLKFIQPSLWRAGALRVDQREAPQAPAETLNT